MPDEPARLADVRAWLAKAGLDLHAAEFEMSSGDSLLFPDAAFHAQQAVEKTLKAFLAWHDRPFRKTHNLEELGEQVLLVDVSLRDVIDGAVPLTEYAWAFRYPGDPDGPTPEEARSALSVARAVLDAVLARLPRDAAP